MVTVVLFFIIRLSGRHNCALHEIVMDEDF